MCKLDVEYRDFFFYDVLLKIVQQSCPFLFIFYVVSQHFTVVDVCKDLRRRMCSITVTRLVAPVEVTLHHPIFSVYCITRRFVRRSLKLRFHADLIELDVDFLSHVKFP